MSNKKNKPIRLVGQKEKKEVAPDPKPKVDEEKKEAKSAYDRMPDTVEDPVSVFKMCLYEEKCKSLEFEKVAKLAHLDNEIRNLQAARNNTMLECDRALRQAHARMMSFKDFIEEKHDLVLKCYTYNDETGVLTKLSEVKKENG